jgi:hypothetical protein
MPPAVFKMMPMKADSGVNRLTVPEMRLLERFTFNGLVLLNRAGHPWLARATPEWALS